MRTVMEAEFGQAGLKAADSGLDKFKARFGDDAVKTIMRYQNTDFVNIQDE
jgi:hypothetical protein